MLGSSWRHLIAQAPKKRVSNQTAFSTASRWPLVCKSQLVFPVGGPGGGEANGLFPCWRRETLGEAISVRKALRRGAEGFFPPPRAVPPRAPGAGAGGGSAGGGSAGQGRAPLLQVSSSAGPVSSARRAAGCWASRALRPRGGLPGRGGRSAEGREGCPVGPVRGRDKRLYEPGGRAGCALGKTWFREEGGWRGKAPQGQDGGTCHLQPGGNASRGEQPCGGRSHGLDFNRAFHRRVLQPQQRSLPKPVCPCPYRSKPAQLGILLDS